jgi:hypothetical protein
MMRSLYKPLYVGILIGLYAMLGWIVGLGVLALQLLRLLHHLVRLRHALAPTTTCPQGHRVSQYGRYACSACGAETLGSAWWCSWCRTPYGHTPCPVCREPVGNPLLRA